jgi:uncharacterized protein YecE (DUF72 family)
VGAPEGIVVGTSSWADPGFVEAWYPPGLPARDRLPYYAERFDGVEVNSTFYAIPSAATVARWVAATPDAFTFDVKLHRVLSRHAAGPDSLPPALRESARTTPRGRVVLDPRLEAALLDATLEAVGPIVDAGRLSSFMLQLTPGFAPRSHELPELRPIVERLAPHPVAIELRHRGWVDRRRVETTLGFFEDAGAVWVAVDAPPGDQITIMPPLDAVTHPRLAYFCAHGRNKRGYVSGRSVPERFGWRYGDDELREIAERVESMHELAPSVRMQFNNNKGSDAPVAAARLKELLGSAMESRM